MKRRPSIIWGVGLLSFGLGFSTRYLTAKQQVIVDPYKITTFNHHNKTTQQNMQLGAFSVSLSVRDIEVSRDFYEKIGFSVFAGDIKNNYLIMKNGNALIGLFQGMFAGNILTFNPGWDENALNVPEFEDVRAIQQQLKDKGVKIDNEADEKATGPASFMMTDPDGNVIYVDQHR